MNSKSAVVRDFAIEEIPGELQSANFLRQLPECSALEESEPAFDYCFSYSRTGLILASRTDRRDAGVGADFLSPALLRRLRQPLQPQLLGKALGLKRQSRPKVLDATAGLGIDALLMAAAGCQVTAIERSSIVFALLEDAWFRAIQVDGETAGYARNMALMHGDFLNLDRQVKRYDVVYLDPMFPQARRKAQAKKAMALLQQILPVEQDEKRLLNQARELASRRVVVKRGRRSPPLAASEPSIQFKGSSNRFDVYLL